MPMYRAKVKCFVDNTIWEEGKEDEYNGPRNTNLEPLETARGRKTSVPDQADAKSKGIRNAGVDNNSE